MKIRKIPLIISLAIIIGQFLTSCNTSLDVVKRKHAHGYYVDISNKIKNNNDKNKTANNYNTSNTTKKNTTNKLAMLNDDISLIASNDFTNTPSIETALANNSESIELVIDPEPVNYKKYNKKILFKNLLPSGRPKKVPGLGIASLVLGIFSILSILFLGFLSILFAILAIVFGAVANSKIRNNPNEYRGRGFGIAGIVLGIITLVLIFLLILLVLALLMAM